MARDQRTRLNAELAHNYGVTRKRGSGATPGRGSLSGELDEKQEGDVDAEVEEQELEAEAEAEQEVEREPKRSLFELPRKEPSRQPLLASPFGAQPSSPAAPAPAPAAPAAPAAPSPTKPKPPRRG